MKRNVVIFLYATLIMLSALPAIARADDSSVALQEDQQIALLQAQVDRLKMLIANVVLEKSIMADAYIIEDMSTGAVIAQKNSQRAYSIASITKLMNAVISTENIDLDKTIKLTPKMLQPEGASPALFASLVISGNNLLKACLIQSVNDAANSLTYFIGTKKFIGLMNQKAKELGMDSTSFSDAYGLNPKNKSTASDLAKLLGYIYKNHPHILAITRENDFWLPGASGKLLHFANVNGVYNSPDFIGGKSGYIPEAKQTLASVALVNGKPVAIVLLSSADRKKDALAMVGWLKSGN